MRSSRSGSFLILFAAALLLPSEAGAFGEEQTAVVGDTTVSTHHLHLTRALAACAGFSYAREENPLTSPLEAETIALYDAMTDKTAIGSLSNCGAGGYSLPTSPTAEGCASAAATTLVHPDPTPNGAGAWRATSGCFTHRQGPYAHFFHHPTAQGLDALKRWAFGTSPTLEGVAHFAYGDATANIETATCYKERQETIDTGRIAAGSLEALGTALHSLADWTSHGLCRDNWGARQNPPWYSHTRTTATEGCERDTHRREYGCPTEAYRGYVEGTIAAANAVFELLKAYAVLRGKTPRVTSFDDHGGWLRRQVERFALSSRENDSAPRMEFAYQLMLACGEIENGVSTVCREDVTAEADAGSVVIASCATIPVTNACVVDAGTFAVSDAGTDAPPSVEPGPNTAPVSDDPPSQVGVPTDSGGACRLMLGENSSGLFLGLVSLATLATLFGRRRERL